MAFALRDSVDDVQVSGDGNVAAEPLRAKLELDDTGRRSPGVCGEAGTQRPEAVLVLRRREEGGGHPAGPADHWI